MSEIDHDDLALLRQYAENGSSAAFAGVVARHADFVFATALRQTRSRDLAEDVTQAAFIVLARRARTLRDGASVAAFLHQTTMFAARNALRAQSRRRRHEKQAAIDPVMPDSSRQNEPMNDGAVAVDCALARLRDGDRQFLMLHYFDGLNVDDLAAKLKISHEAARKRLHRALARLRANLTHAGTATTTAAVPAIIAALGHPAASIDASAVASTAVAGGINGRAFELAHGMLTHTKLAALSKVIAVAALIAIVTGGTEIAIQRMNRSSERGMTSNHVAKIAPRGGTFASGNTNGPTVIDYALVFDGMKETRDEKQRDNQLRKQAQEWFSKRQAEIRQLRANRDAAPKNSPEYVRLDEAVSKATTVLTVDSRTIQQNVQRTQIQMMAMLYQKIEVAVTAVGAMHHLQLLPPAEPAYPARADAITVEGLRILLNKRALPRPKDAPDMNKEVLAYLDSHPEIQIRGVPLPSTTATSMPSDFPTGR